MKVDAKTSQPLLCLIKAMENNPIIRHKFTADPTVLVYKDKVYLYTGHDEAPLGTSSYVMNNWLCFSSADLVNWQEHPSPLKATDFNWASGDAFASKVIHKDNRFYWFAAVSHASIKGKAIGVAVSESPEGPFQDAKGSALISHDMLPDTDNEMANLDPSVIIDDKGHAYIFWGHQVCYYAKLSADLTGLEGPINIIGLPQFSEGANLSRRGEWYYLSYGYGMPERVGYAMSKGLEGPWVFQGILNEVPGNCETNRPAIVEFKGNWYFFYHNGVLKNGNSHHRSVCIDHLVYLSDGRFKRVQMTSEGV